MIDQYALRVTDEMKSILKSFEFEKIIVTRLEENLEHIIGSKIVEHLELDEIETENVNWTFISSLERLKSLIISGYYQAVPSLFEFLKLE